MRTRMSIVTAAAMLGAALTASFGSTATAESSAVTAFPGPGDSYAQPHTGLTFRGADPSALDGLRVVGSRSGVHSGSLTALADGRGAVFRPATAFSPGETVTVDAGVPVTGGAQTYRFTVARPASAPATVPDEDAVVGAHDATATAACTPRARMTYVSRPDLHPVGACVLANNGKAGTGYLLTTPGGETGGGPTVYDNSGNPVWYQPVSSPVVHDLKVVRVQGQAPMLAYYAGPRGDDPGHGSGHYTLLDQHYQPAWQITAGNGFNADFHELLVTPRGTAYVASYQPVPRAVGSADRIVYDYVVQEVDYQHEGNQVLFEWHAADHVPLAESWTPPPATGPWDYFHGNSIAEDTDGNLLISARNTSTVYKVDKTTGAVIWKLGDPKNHTGTFRTLNGSPAGWFCYQHDARIVTLGGTTFYTLYDDGGGGPGCNHAARGMKMTIDPGAKTATLVKGYHHSPDIFTQYTGSTRIQADGNMLVGWANVPQLTEFAEDGSVALDMRLAAASYRSIREDWQGSPVVPPDLAVRRDGSKTTAYASWNGATEVASWRLLTGDSAATLHTSLTVGRKGFETALPVPSGAKVVQVQALDAAGNVLDHGTSQPVAGTQFFSERSAGPPYYRNDYRMIVGDFGGSSADDILAYTPGNGPDYLSISDGNGGWSQQLLPQIARTWTPLVGNFTGDSHDEIIWWDPVNTTANLARAPFTAHWRPIQVPAVRHAEILDHGSRTGDAVYDEVLWWGPNIRIAQVEHFAWPAGRDLTVHRLDVGPLRYEFHPLVGDFDGNGFADVLWYGPGSLPDWVWDFNGSQPGTATRYTSHRINLGRTGYQPVVGRFGPGDSIDDVLFYTPGSGVDWLWRGRSNGTFLSTDVTTGNSGIAMTLQGDANADAVALWQPGTDVRIWNFEPHSAIGAVQLAGNTILDAAYHPSAGRFVGGVFGLYWYAAGTDPERLWQPVP